MSRRKNEPPRAPNRVRFPGFNATEDVGLGDAIKRVTSYLGIPSCGRCARRQAWLNGRVTFTGPRLTK